MTKHQHKRRRQRQRAAREARRVTVAHQPPARRSPLQRFVDWLVS